MYKKHFITFILLFSLSLLLFCLSVFAEEKTHITPTDFDGNFKVYYNNPVTTAAGNVNDIFTVITADNDTVADITRLVVYTENNDNKNIFEFLLPENCNPTKLIIYQDFLFVYDLNNKTNINIYDIAINNLSLNQTFNDNDKVIDDLSIANDTLFLLADQKVYKYNLTTDANVLSINYDVFYDFSTLRMPYEVAAIDSNNFVLCELGKITKANIDGTTTNISNITGCNLSIFNDKLYYYDTQNTVYCYDLNNSNTETYILSQSNTPLNEEIKSLKNIYADSNGIYITDNILKKVVKFDSDLNYADFCLCSGSYEQGRFFNPENVSVNENSITVCDYNRIQIFNDNNTIQSIILDKNPEFAYIDDNNILYTYINNDIYTCLLTNDITQSDFSIADKPSGMTDIMDIKLSCDNKLYVLTQNAVYTVDSSGSYNYCFAINGGTKISINSKTRNIFILTENNIQMFDNKFINIGNIALPDTVIYKEIQSDFNQNIYLITDNNGVYEIVKLGGENYIDSQNYIIDNVKDNLQSFAFNTLSGDFYTVEKNTHIVYVLSKQDMNVAVASDIPNITLPSNPENTEFVSTPQTIIINGYPSTMFYPFDNSLIDEDFYPDNLAYNGQIDYIPENTTVLSIYDTLFYYLIFYNDNLGFVLKDNIELQDDVDIEFTGKTLLNIDVYNIPYFINNNANENYFVKFSIEKWETVNVLYQLNDYDNGDIDWLYIEYNEQYGFISKTNLTVFTENEQMPYTEGKISANDNIVNLFEKADGENILITLNDNDNIKIFYQREEYSYISVTDENENEIKGYILTEFIAVDNSFEKRKTGFLLLLGTIGLSIVFAFIKRKCFY